MEQEKLKLFSGIKQPDSEQEPRFPGVIDIEWIYNSETNNYEPAVKPEKKIKS
ncbi:MAG: hypothetical protein Q7R97_02590 [Candidatus Daviesbacteria bacterium]|nr:hypothetical protein [Candidatus Daviesbacteria bacterium]